VLGGGRTERSPNSHTIAEMAWAQQSNAAFRSQAPGLVPAAPASVVPPSTDSLLSRFGLMSGDEILGRFLVGDSGNEWRWFRGVSAFMAAD